VNAPRASLFTTAAVLALLMVGLYALGQQRERDFQETAALQSITRMEVELTRAIIEALQPEQLGVARWSVGPDTPKPPRAWSQDGQSFRQATEANRARRAWEAGRAEGEGVRFVEGGRDTFLVVPVDDTAQVLLWEDVSKRISQRTGIRVSRRDGARTPGPDALPVLAGLVDPETKLWAKPRLPTRALLDSKLLLVLGGFFGVAYLSREVMLTRRLSAQERAAAEAREALLSRISHELRTPAAAVGALADALGSGVVAPAERGQFHSLIKSESTRLSQGIERMLRAARRGDAPPLERVEVDLAEWARALAERWAARVDAVDLDAPDHLPARVDPERLDEAFDALIDNARKYGEPPVLITLQATAGGIEIAVEDDGAGIPEGHRGRIFERLERVEGVADDPGGFGLGLWAAREVARAHGGELRLEGGNRFVMTLPAR